MPTYQYVCTDCDEPHEAVQAFTDDALTDCPTCDDGRLRKVFGSVGVVFKGSGFYATDNRSKGAQKSITADYLRQLTEAYNYFFHHYRETPLLVVDTNQIDFVKRKEDLEDLIRQVTRPFRGTQFYVPRVSR